MKTSKRFAKQSKNSKQKRNHSKKEKRPAEVKPESHAY